MDRSPPAGVLVPPVSLVGATVGEEVQAFFRPDDPVVRWRQVRCVPGNGELAGARAGETEVGDRAVPYLTVRLGRRGGAGRCGPCPVPVRAQRQHRVVIGGLRGHGGVRVLRAGVPGVLCDGGQGVGVSSPQHPVTGDGPPAGGRPADGHAVMGHSRGGETGGRRRRLRRRRRGWLRLRRRVFLDPGGGRGRPRTAPWTVVVSAAGVPGAGHDLEGLALGQPGEGDRPLLAAGVLVPPAGLVGVLVGEEVQALFRPNNPVVRRGRVGRIPGDRQLAGGGAGEAEVGDGAAVALGLGDQTSEEEGRDHGRGREGGEGYTSPPRGGG